MSFSIVSVKDMPIMFNGVIGGVSFRISYDVDKKELKDLIINISDEDGICIVSSSNDKEYSINHYDQESLSTLVNNIGKTGRYFINEDGFNRRGIMPDDSKRMQIANCFDLVNNIIINPNLFKMNEDEIRL